MITVYCKTETNAQAFTTNIFPLCLWGKQTFMVKSSIWVIVQAREHGLILFITANVLHHWRRLVAH